VAHGGGGLVLRAIIYVVVEKHVKGLKPHASEKRCPKKEPKIRYHMATLYS